VGAAFGFSSCASLRLILVLKLVRSGRPRRCGPVRVTGSRALRGVRPRGPAGSFIRRAPNGNYPVERSGLRTLPDGEFDWGGTSVKR
jgi:hypothetical protein